MDQSSIHFIALFYELLNLTNSLLDASEKWVKLRVGACRYACRPMGILWWTWFAKYYVSMVHRSCVFSIHCQPLNITWPIDHTPASCTAWSNSARRCNVWQNCHIMGLMAYRNKFLLAWPWYFYNSLQFMLPDSSNKAFKECRTAWLVLSAPFYFSTILLSHYLYPSNT